GGGRRAVSRAVGAAVHDILDRGAAAAGLAAGGHGRCRIRLRPVKVGGSARLQGSELQGPLLARLPDGSVALVDRCASGDEAAWRELHDTYRPVVVRFLRRMGLDAFEAADGAQEVFIQVHRYLWRFE